MYTAEDWSREAVWAKASGKRVVIGASCEECHLEISPEEAAEDQCHCGKMVTLVELAIAHGLEEIPFSISEIPMKEKTG